MFAYEHFPTHRGCVYFWEANQRIPNTVKAKGYHFTAHTETIHVKAEAPSLNRMQVTVTRQTTVRVKRTAQFLTTVLRCPLTKCLAFISSTLNFYLVPDPTHYSKWDTNSLWSSSCEMEERVGLSAPPVFKVELRQAGAPLMSSLPI